MNGRIFDKKEDIFYIIENYLKTVLGVQIKNIDEIIYDSENDITEADNILYAFKELNFYDEHTLQTTAIHYHIKCFNDQILHAVSSPVAITPASVVYYENKLKLINVLCKSVMNQAPLELCHISGIGYKIEIIPIPN